jgi:FHS family L-fucose permease-like MFS transporter
MIGRFLGSIMLSRLTDRKKYIYSLYVLFLSFLVGWFILSASFIEGAFMFNSQPVNGLIFFGIALINFFAMLLGKGNANISLGFFGIIASILAFIAFLSPISIGMWALLAIGFFNSIMFPTIFSLAVKDLDADEMPIASGIINTLIVGGALIPLTMGWITDHAGIRIALILPVICFAYIAFFALKGSKIRQIKQL